MMKLNDYIDPLILVEMIEKDYVEKKHSPCGNFFLLDYTRNATFDNIWNEATIASRGLVVDVKTTEIVGFAIPKFHNIQESADHHLRSYKECIDKKIPFEATEKMDGSFINCWWNGYTGKWQCSTRGSFTSDQAIWATEWFNKKRLDGKIEIDRGCWTYSQFNLIFECIYPENRIVVDYGDTEELVLLTAYEHDGKEWSFEPICALAHLNGFVRPTHYKFKSIEEIVQQCETLDGNHEGYVLKFDNGFRIKIKGKEYCNLHKIISGLSTKSVWENIDPISLEINKEWLMFIPEEFRGETEKYGQSLIEKAQVEYILYISKYYEVVKVLTTSKKDFVMRVKDMYPSALSALIMIYEGKPEELRKRIWENLKPEYRKLSII